MGMKCDSQPSHLAHTFTSPCFGRELKARVVTNGIKHNKIFYRSNREE
jgi:hypothetical protein